MALVSTHCTRSAAKNIVLFPEQNAKMEKLRQKYDLYIRLSQAKLGPHGAVPDTRCDGLLFSCLYYAATHTYGDFVDYGAWLENGKPYRSPDKQCYPQHSHSSISKDMGLGLALCLAVDNQKDRAKQIVKQVIDYGNANSYWLWWEMGEGSPDRVMWPPTLQSHFYRLDDILNNRKNGEISKIKPFVGYEKGYALHLQELSILLWGLTNKGVDTLQLAALRVNAEKHPNNALFSAIHGKFSRSSQTKALDLLLDSKLFPATRLPSTDDRRDFYIYQRDQMHRETLKADKEGCLVAPGLHRCGFGSYSYHDIKWPNLDWLPCPECPREEFSGTDFLMAAAIVLGLL